VTAVVIALLLSGAAIAIATIANSTQAANTVATVSGEPVTRNELLFHMDRLAPTVQNALQVETGETGAAIDWAADINGTPALTRLREAALEEIVTDKTLLMLAEENGSADPVDFDDLVVAMNDENAARQSAVARGETVYGLTAFTLDEYYSHTLTEARTALLETLSEGDDAPLAVTAAEVETYFAANRTDWQANATTYSYSVLVVPVADTAAVNAVQHTVDAAGNVAAATSTIPGSILATATLGGDVPIGPGGRDQEILTQLRALAVGQLSAPVVVDAQATFYQLDAVSIDDERAFKTYSSRIEQTLREQSFDALLAERIHQNAVTENDKALDSITPEELER
jgi:hypothetical protein